MTTGGMFTPGGITMNDFLKTPLSEVYDQDDPPPPDLVVEPKPAYEEDRDAPVVNPLEDA